MIADPASYPCNISSLWNICNCINITMTFKSLCFITGREWSLWHQIKISQNQLKMTCYSASKVGWERNTLKSMWLGSPKQSSTKLLDKDYQKNSNWITKYHSKIPKNFCRKKKYSRMALYKRSQRRYCFCLSLRR